MLNPEHSEKFAPKLSFNGVEYNFVQARTFNTTGEAAYIKQLLKYVGPYGETIAVKVPREHIDFGSAKDLLRNEFAILERLERGHATHFPRPIGIIESPFGIAVSFCEGKSLADLYPLYKSLSDLQRLDIARELITAFEEARNTGVLIYDWKMSDAIIDIKKEPPEVHYVDLNNATDNTLYPLGNEYDLYRSLNDLWRHILVGLIPRDDPKLQELKGPMDRVEMGYSRTTDKSIPEFNEVLEKLKRRLDDLFYESMTSNVAPPSATLKPENFGTIGTKITETSIREDDYKYQVGSLVDRMQNVADKKKQEEIVRTEVERALGRDVLKEKEDFLKIHLKLTQREQSLLDSIYQSTFIGYTDNINKKAALTQIFVDAHLGTNSGLGAIRILNGANASSYLPLEYRKNIIDKAYEIEKGMGTFRPCSFIEDLMDHISKKPFRIFAEEEVKKEGMVPIWQQRHREELTGYVNSKIGNLSKQDIQNLFSTAQRFADFYGKEEFLDWLFSLQN